MIKFFGPNVAQTTPISAGTQVTGFSSAYFTFGDVTGAPSVVGYNRTLSFSTNTESTRMAISPSRISQGAGGFSSTNIYHINGYNTGIVTTKNKVFAASDSFTTASISLTVERRGMTINLPHITKSKIYLLGGYSDGLGQYRADGTYISTASDTATNTTAIPAARHVSVGLYESNNAYVIGGYNSSGANTSTIYKYIMTTDTASTLSATDVVINSQGYAFSNSAWGYRANGGAVTSSSNIKFTFSTETRSTGSNSPEGSLNLFQGVCSATSTAGYVWTGYRSATLNRALHILTFSTEVWTNNSYTTADTNSGWINGNSGA